MEFTDIVSLHKHPTYPSVSLLAGVPDEHRELVKATLRMQLRETEERLELEFDSTEVQELLEDLHRTIAEVEPDSYARSIAVFVSRRESSWVSLPVTVRERVVVDETFATRDVVHALLRARRYRVLILGTRSQLFEGTGQVLTPVTTGRFPVLVEESRAGDAPRRPERAERDRRRQRIATRAVDDALDVHLRNDPCPLFVIGVQPRLAWFEQHSRHRRAISSTAVGAPQSLHATRDAVLPLVDELFDETARAALDQIDAARSRHRLATGINETWQLAREGRGALVVVEESYEYPAILGDDPADVRPAPDAAAPDVVDDLVDETIETVLAQGGRVVLVPDGSLSVYERICLTLRY